MAVQPAGLCTHGASRQSSSAVLPVSTTGYTGDHSHGQELASDGASSNAKQKIKEITYIILIKYNLLYISKI